MANNDIPTEHKYQVWVNDTHLVGHIYSMNDEKNAIHEAVNHAKRVWDDRIQTPQVSICEIGYNYYFDLAESSADLGMWA